MPPASLGTDEKLYGMFWEPTPNKLLRLCKLDDEYVWDGTLYPQGAIIFQGSKADAEAYLERRKPLFKDCKPTFVAALPLVMVDQTDGDD